MGRRFTWSDERVAPTLSPTGPGVCLNGLGATFSTVYPAELCFRRRRLLPSTFGFAGVHHGEKKIPLQKLLAQT
jgi:hypothetical protein